jgi:predicted dehydrogenase
MPTPLHRRAFMRQSAQSALGLSLLSFPEIIAAQKPAGGRIGIIGLDTSHSTAFTKALNGTNTNPLFEGFRVVAAYPRGSADIESSVKRIPGYTEDVKKLGVEIVDSIQSLLSKVDFVLLETNDGRPHFDQALQVIKAGKPLFVDKPVAASLSDVIALYSVAAKYKVPVFSSSSLRYMETVQQAIQGKAGAILGADTFSPATLEKTHPDFFWYGIHGVEILYTLMGRGCRELVRVNSANTDIVVGSWQDGRTGTFRGTRTGTHDYGGTAYCEKGNLVLGPFKGYDNLLEQIIAFFKSGTAPVAPEDTIEIYTFMEAADESRRNGGATVQLKKVYDKHAAIAAAKISAS